MLHSMIPWPEQEDLRCNLPLSFKNYKKTNNSRLCGNSNRDMSRSQVQGSDILPVQEEAHSKVLCWNRSIRAHYIYESILWRQSIRQADCQPIWNSAQVGSW